MDQNSQFFLCSLLINPYRSVLSEGWPKCLFWYDQ